METRLVLLLLGSSILAGCLSKSADPEDSNSALWSPTGDNSAPSISGSAPPAVVMGTTYSFTPQASDADGDTLTFSIQNRPEWASFDTQTGRIWGTPTLGAVGVYNNVRISVSDGTDTASLKFGVEVTSSALGSVSLSWAAPTLNEDGTTLTDLAGYKIYYGTNANDLNTMIRIDNSSVLTYLIDNLAPNTYFFAAAAFNSSGVDSELSGQISRVVN